MEQDKKPWWQRLRDRLTNGAAVQPVPDAQAAIDALAIKEQKPYEGRINTGAGHLSFYVRATSLKEAHEKVKAQYIESLTIKVTPYLGNKKVK